MQLARLVWCLMAGFCVIGPSFCLAQPSIPKERIPADLSPEAIEKLGKLYAPKAKDRCRAVDDLDDSDRRVLPFVVALLDDNEVDFEQVNKYYTEEMRVSRTIYQRAPGTYGSWWYSPSVCAGRKLFGARQAGIEALVAAVRQRPEAEFAWARDPSLPCSAYLPEQEKNPGAWNRYTPAQRYAAVLGEMHGLQRYEQARNDERKWARDATIALFADKDWRVRWLGASAFARFAQVKDAEAVVPLRALLADPEARVRAAAVWSLGHFDKVPGAGDAVFAATRDAHVWVRWTATCALSLLQDARADAAFLAALDEPEPAIRIEAVGRLIWGGGKPRAGEAFVKALKDSDASVGA